MTDSTDDHRLVDLVAGIVSVVASEMRGPRRRQLIVDNIRENELDDDSAVPDWLIALLTAVRDRRFTDWIDFPRDVSVDDTNVFDFVRELPQLVPVVYVNNEESWLLTFHDIDVEACISLEGSCYKVSPIGQTWV